MAHPESLLQIQTDESDRKLKISLKPESFSMQALKEIVFYQLLGSRLYTMGILIIHQGRPDHYISSKEFEDKSYLDNKKRNSFVNKTAAEMSFASEIMLLREEPLF